MQLSVIVPIYNEEKTIQQLLDRLMSAIDGASITSEVIVVDDGSTDGTKRKLEESAWFSDTRFRFIFSKENQGKGSAIREAIPHARGEYTVIQDGDLEYDPEDIVQILSYAQRGSHTAVYGSRDLEGKTRGTPLFYWGGRVVTSVANVLFGQTMTDEPTCYKLIRTSTLQSFPLQAKKFEFCPEVTAYLAMMGTHIKELPISYAPRGKDAGKKINWKDGIHALWTLLRLRFSVRYGWGMPALLGVAVFAAYLATWHSGFGGYEKETLDSAYAMLQGDYGVKRAGIMAALLYVPFIWMFRALGIESMSVLSIVPIPHTLSLNKKKALVVALLTAFGSMMWPYTNIGMEYQAMLFLSLLLYFLARWQLNRAPLWKAGLAAAALILSKSYGIVFGLPVLLFLYASPKRAESREVLWATVPSVLAVALILVMNVVSHGALSGTYSLAHEFQVWSWWEGFYGIFFSYGKGLLFFSPLIVLSLMGYRYFWLRHRATTWFVLSSAVLLLLITAPFSYWTDETWGVRKLVPVLLLLHLPLLYVFKKGRSIMGKVLLSMCIVFAIYVQLLGATYTYGKQLAILRDAGVDTLQHMRFTPQFSHLAVHHELLQSSLLKSDATLAYTESTWFRWTVGQDDIVVENIALVITDYATPDIYWLRDATGLKYVIFFAIVAVGLGALGTLAYHYRRI